MKAVVDWGKVAGGGFADCDVCDWESYTGPARDLASVRGKAKIHTLQTGHTTHVETITRWMFEARS